MSLKETYEHLKDQLFECAENQNIKITRLSYGLPMGAEIDYLDVLTLERALIDRKEVS